MAEKFPQQGAGENVHYTIENTPHLQEFFDKKSLIEEQMRQIEDRKADLKKDRDVREKMNRALFNRFGGEQVYQDKLAALNSELMSAEDNLHDLQDLYNRLGGDRIEDLKTELMQRTGGKTRGTWSVEAMNTFRELEKAQRQFEDNYEDYQNAPRSLGDDNAEYKQLPPAPEDNPSSLEDQLAEANKRVAVLEEDRGKTQQQLDEALQQLNETRQQLNEALEQLNEKKKPKWSWEKFGKRTVLKWLAGVSLVATGVASVFAGYGISAAAQEEDGPKAASTYELNSSSNTEDDSTFSTMVDLGRGRQGSETSTNNEADTVRGYNRGEDPFFAEGKTAEYNMSNGFDVNGAPEQARTGWLDDVLRSPEMMSMVMAEAGLNNNPAELDDLLTNSPVVFEQHRELVRQLIENATDVHYETLPAGTVYNTWYTALDENGDPQLVQSEGISHDHDVTLLVMDVQVNGQEVTLKINSECGQGISARMYDNVPVFIPDTGTPDQPVTPGDNTPPTPTTPGEGTPPPTTPGEDTPPTPTTPPEDENPTPHDAEKSGQRSDYPQPGAGSETDSGEGEKPRSEADSEAQDSAGVQQETSESDSSSSQPGSGTNTNAPGTDGNTVGGSGPVEGAGDGQTNTDTVAGP